MLQLHGVVSLGLTVLLPAAFAYPQDIHLTVARVKPTPNPNFIVGAIGDSWASGVTYTALPGNNYDDNKDGCMRYKYAWSTVVNASYAQWAPTAGTRSEFEFRACSGARLNNMKDQMDKLTRPKLVIMEVGGNNADFYGLADSCLFHQDSKKDYGALYENDPDPNNPVGECRKEIKAVRDRLTGENMDRFQTEFRQTIHDWRGHKSVLGNDATLLVLGYGRFFALGDECDRWDFNVPWGTNETQKLKLGMRKEINELTNLMNTAIRTATESFNDQKIQYIDINPAFEGHRFCEPGDSWYAQINWGSKVRIWNSPVRVIYTITMGKDIKTYEIDAGPAPPADLFNSLSQHPDGKPRIEGEYSILTFRDPKNPDTTMEWKAIPQGPPVSTTDGRGSISRTLHPTMDGHREMGNIIVQRLQQIYKGASGPIVVPNPNCPAGCTCNGITPLCT